MCGIAGRVNRTSQISETDILNRMLDVIEHRGPDDFGLYTDNQLVMGMRRLSIIDLSTGKQPIASTDGSKIVICNGEIYNYRTIRTQLIEMGYQFKTESDTEVLVHAYDEWGLDFIHRIDGMFGFAIWDKTIGRLIVARDRLGIKPLYYRQDGSQLSFGSEVKSFIEEPEYEPKICPIGLQDLLAYGFTLAPQTIFKGVSKLAPGEMLIWEQGSIEKVRYWKLSDEIEGGRNVSEWHERIEAAFQETISSHLVSDVPLGAFLSGGIDSSAIVSIMSSQFDTPVETFSIGYSGNKVAEYYNELSFAKEIADEFGTQHKEINVQPEIATLLPKILWHIEEPISDTAMITTYLVSEWARQSVTVVLSGVGGDELFAGYRRYLGIHYDRVYGRVPKWLRRGLLEPVINLLPAGRNNRLMDLARYAKHYVRTHGAPWQDKYKSYLTITEADQVNALRTSCRTLPDSFEALAGRISATDPFLQMMQLDLETQLPEALLLVSDKMTMAHSLEGRVPFLDHKFVELSARIPVTHKLPGSELKPLLKQTFANHLPQSVIDRSKRGFGAPVGYWAENDLRPLVDHLLDPQQVAERGLLNPGAVKQIRSDHARGVSDYTDLIMVLMNLEIWHRLFVDGQEVAEVADQLEYWVKAK